MKNRSFKFLSEEEKHEENKQMTIFDFEKQQELRPEDQFYFVGSRIYVDYQNGNKIRKNFGIHKVEIEKIEENDYIFSTGLHKVKISKNDENRYFFRNRLDAEKNYCSRIGKTKPGEPELIRDMDIKVLKE